MKKNNGFTLIELLAVIIILAAIALVAFPVLLNTIKNSENQIDETTEKLVINATKLYIDDNLNDYPKTNGNIYCISFDNLIANKYMEKGIIESTGVEFTNKVVKVIVNNSYMYEITDNGSCTGNGKMLTNF